MRQNEVVHKMYQFVPVHCKRVLFADQLQIVCL